MQYNMSTWRGFFEPSASYTCPLSESEPQAKEEVRGQGIIESIVTQRMTARVRQIESSEVAGISGLYSCLIRAPARREESGGVPSGGLRKG